MFGLFGVRGGRSILPSMRSPLLLVLVLAGCATAAPASQPEPVGATTPSAYRVYDSDGRPSSMDAIFAASRDVSAVLVGEEHDDEVGHAVEAELFDGVVRGAGSRPVALSLEMFERDVQTVVDEYLQGVITEPYFLAAARPWPAYRTAYRPMVELARSRGLRVIAANAPRRYVNLATRVGVDSLSGLGAEALRSLPPLPLPSPSDRYRLKFDSMMAEGGSHAGMPPHMFAGQRLWDAAMGNAVAAALYERPDALVVHYAGGFHVERRLGTAESLLHFRPRTTFLVVAIRSADDPASFLPVHEGLGDYVVLTQKR